MCSPSNWVGGKPAEKVRRGEGGAPRHPASPQATWTTTARKWRSSFPSTCSPPWGPASARPPAPRPAPAPASRPLQRRALSPRSPHDRVGQRPGLPDSRLPRVSTALEASLPGPPLRGRARPSRARGLCCCGRAVPLARRGLCVTPVAVGARTDTASSATGTLSPTPPAWEDLSLEAVSVTRIVTMPANQHLRKHPPCRTCPRLTRTALGGRPPRVNAR